MQISAGSFGDIDEITCKNTIKEERANRGEGGGKQIRGGKGASGVKSVLTTLAKKVGTATRQRAQARDLSSMQAPVVWRACLSQFFWPG